MQLLTESYLIFVNKGTLFRLVTYRFLLFTVDGFNGAVNFIRQTKLSVLNFKSLYTIADPSGNRLDCYVSRSHYKSSPMHIFK